MTFLIIIETYSLVFLRTACLNNKIEKLIIFQVFFKFSKVYPLKYQKTKMVDAVLNLGSCKIPTCDILRHRNEFYRLQRSTDDQTTAWLEQVQSCIRRCEYPTIFMEFLLFDRFVCGLNAKELKSILCENKSWSLTQLLEHFSNESNDNIEATSTADQNVNQSNVISPHLVKSETVCSFLVCLTQNRRGSSSFLIYPFRSD